jgi:hypothetical protein
MTRRSLHVPGFTALALLLTLPLSVSPAIAQTSGDAQSGGGAAHGGIGFTDTVTARARVKAVNQKTRTVTLVGADNHVFTLKVGDEVRNLAQVRPGNTVVVRYTASTILVLAPPGQQIPQDQINVAAARAAPGQMPAGAAAARLIVTGLVVAVDPVAKTVSLVDPRGGAVRTLHVNDPDIAGRLSRVNVGDTVTAYITDAIAVSVEPTR